MSTAFYVPPDTAIPDTPHIRVMRRQEGVTLEGTGDVLTATVTTGGYRYVLTNHAVIRFMERVTGPAPSLDAEKARKRVEKIFPHLDLSEPDQALFAIIILLRQGKHGRFLRAKNRGTACYASGWLFVLVEEKGISNVVTCFPKDKTMKFYG